MTQKQLKARMKKLKKNACRRRMQKLLDDTTHIDSLTDLDSAKQLTLQVSPTIKKLAVILEDMPLESELQPDDGAYMTAQAIGLFKELYKSGDIVPDEEGGKREERDRQLRAAANTSSKLLKKMCDAVDGIAAQPDFESAMQVIYAFRQDLEKLARNLTGLAYKPGPRDPTLAGARMSKEAVALFKHLYLSGEIILPDELPAMISDDVHHGDGTQK